MTPSRLPAETLEAVSLLTAQAAAALGLVEGPIHAELRIDGGSVCMLELAARSIGGLCSRSLRFGMGVSLEELREAIRAANNRTGRDEVVLGEGTYELEILPVDGPANESGQLVSFGKVTIEGLGPRETRIDANGIDRVLLVTSRSTVEGLTVKGGDAGANPFHSSDAGGILGIGERLVLSNVVVKQNAAQFGGGVAYFGSGDPAKLTIRDSTIARNNAGEGGGIHLSAGFTQGLLELRSSTISGNTAGKGGGILADGFAPSTQIPPILDIDNSTVAGNNASGQGGGIFGDNDAIVVVDNSTVAYNMADSDNTGGGVGGGIHQFNDASFQFNDSVLALNSVGSSGSGPACDGDFEDGGSLVDTTGTNPNCNFVGLIQPSVTTTPLIGPLADNGGPTKTVKLLAGSPAIGLSLNCPKLDQRGKDRPEEDCDSGAFERKGP